MAVGDEEGARVGGARERHALHLAHFPLVPVEQGVRVAHRWDGFVRGSRRPEPEHAAGLEEEVRHPIARGVCSERLVRRGGARSSDFVRERLDRKPRLAIDPRHRSVSARAAAENGRLQGEKGTRASRAAVVAAQPAMTNARGAASFGRARSSPAHRTASRSPGRASAAKARTMLEQGARQRRPLARGDCREDDQQLGDEDAERRKPGQADERGEERAVRCRRATGSRRSRTFVLPRSCCAMPIERKAAALLNARG